VIRDGDFRKQREGILPLRTIDQMRNLALGMKGKRLKPKDLINPTGESNYAWAEKSWSA